MHLFVRVRNLGFWMILSQFLWNSLKQTKLPYYIRVYITVLDQFLR